MAVVSSGEIKLIGDVNLEINGNTTDTNVSLITLSVGASFTEPHGLTEFYGYVDAIAPSVSTGSASSVGQTSMTISGNVTSDGGGTITERGFYFGTNSSAATSNTKYVVSGTTGGYSRSMTGLSASSTYYFWAYATNSVGTTIGSRNQATTAQPTIPYTMVGAQSYHPVPNVAGMFACGYAANIYPGWGNSSYLRLSGTNTLGTTVTCYAFIGGGYGFVASPRWSSNVTTGVTRSNPYVYVANGYNIGPSGLDINPDTSSTSSQTVACGFIGRTYVQTSASGYGARNTEVAQQPFY
jgi:hypothetical protein